MSTANKTVTSQPRQRRSLPQRTWDIIVHVFEDFKEGMMLYGECIASLINTIVLTIVYVIGVGITNLVARIVGKRFLDLELSKESKSYWRPLKLSTQSRGRYYRQY